MTVLQAWPNLQFLGELRKVKLNVFMRKLDHALDFSHIIADKLKELNVPAITVSRVTKQVTINGLVVTDHYALYYNEESAIFAKIVLAGQLGYRTEKGW